MRYPILALFSLLYTLSFGQKADFYLDENNVISTGKTAIACYKNEDLTRNEYLICYDCYNPARKLVKQINTGLYVNKKLYNDSTRSYIKKYDKKDYLIGEYKDEKPFNGFFKVEDPSYKEWEMFDFYLNGQKIEQIYKDIFRGMLEGEEDVETNWFAINTKSTFKNGKLENGIRIKNIRTGGGSVYITEYVSNSQTDYFIIGVFAIHYGEFLKIKAADGGYLFESLGRDYQMTVSCSKKDRIVQLTNTAQTLKETATFRRYELDDPIPSSSEQKINFLLKDKKIYREILSNDSLLIWLDKNHWEDSEKSVSDFLIEFAIGFYCCEQDLSIEDLSLFIENGNWKCIKNIGCYYQDAHTKFGVNYEKGSLPGKYNMIVYDVDGAISSKEKNISIDKILEIRKKQDN